MLVTIIGSGNVATVMGKILREKGHSIPEVYSRNANHAAELAALLQAKPVTDLHQVSAGSDLYLVAVTDDAIEEVASQLSLTDQLVVHTAGSVSKEVLKNTSTRYGVIWPMKMIRKPMTGLMPVTMVVDGNSEKVVAELEELARVFSTVITRADDETRVKMHMLAAITANFSNHLYHLAADYCELEQIDFSLFYPIIQETALQVQRQHPKEIQAGPASRGDRKTVEKHLLLLEKYPRISKIYRLMSESITGYFGKTLP